MPNVTLADSISRTFDMLPLTLNDFALHETRSKNVIFLSIFIQTGLLIVSQVVNLFLSS